MCEIETLTGFVLIPVLELEPYHFSKQNHPQPSTMVANLPDDWNRYWLNCLADSGITGLQPLYPGSWHVATSKFMNKSMLEKLLTVVFTRWGGIETLIEPDCDPMLSGGLALLDHAGNVLVNPQCCADLGNFNDWQDAANYRGEEWTMLWIGHPWLSIRFLDGDLIVSQPHESDNPIERWRFKLSDLENALVDAASELRRFARQIAPILVSQGFQGDSEAMSEKLVGLRKTYE